MALQSSGQISLGDIAAEYGGSAPHSLSEYYGDGNAPSSGEIQLAADFYGTSSFTSLSASGGSVSTSGIYKYHTFTSSGTFTVSATGTSNTLEYVVVAGGGGGGKRHAAGGGAGGYRTGSTSTNGRGGGSGTSGQGNPGGGSAPGGSGGGGGGRNASGSYSSGSGGPGGSGATWLNGTAYAGGGGGAPGGSGGAGGGAPHNTAAPANRGGGGGGGDSDNPGRPGGSGVVIVRYQYIAS